MANDQDILDSESAISQAGQWPRLIARAGTRLARALRKRGFLTPLRTARIASGCLPHAARRVLLSRLEALGWLDSEARIPFDIFERADCPIRATGGEREIWRLAVFGVSGQGHLSDAKRREAVYQQRCAEIMREVRDLESLTYAAARALGHPEVNADPVLAGMLRAFIAEREAELRARAPIDVSDAKRSRPARSEFQEFQLPLRERVQRTLSRLRQELDRHLSHYNEAGAREALVRIRDLRKRFPGQVGLESVEKCEELVRSLGEKREDFRRHLDQLVEHARVALSGGDPKTSTWVLRRLSAIHSLLPAVLPEDRLEQYRLALLELEQREERHEAARKLVSRERAVGDEIKNLNAAIRRYHEMLGAKDVAIGALEQSEAAYREAAARVRACNDEWLADLMIELDGLLEELQGPRARAEAQVDRFVNNVRLALRKMRIEIGQIQNELAATGRDPGET